MVKKTIFGVAVVALAALVMAPAASATCAGPRTMNTYNSVTGNFVYWHAAGGDDGTSPLVGRAWQLGNVGAFDSAGGTDCNSVSLLYWAHSATGIGVGADFSTCGAGCPAAGATVALYASKAGAAETDVLVATVAETPTGASNFDFSQLTAVLVPLKVVVNSSGPRSANSMPLTVSVPPVAAGAYGPSNAISGYRIVSALSVADPGPNASAYSAVTGGSIAAAGGTAGAPTALTLDCTDPTNTKDQWVAVQLAMDGGAVFSPTVSVRKRVHCAGALAEPKYNKVVPPKKTIAPGQNN